MEMIFSNYLVPNIRCANTVYFVLLTTLSSLVAIGVVVIEIFFISLMLNLAYHVIERSYDFINENSSLYVTTMFVGHKHYVRGDAVFLVIEE